MDATQKPSQHSAQTPAKASRDENSAHDNIEQAVTVLRGEAQALEQLANSIDTNFDQAVEAIHEMKNKPSGAGRLIVAGIGKSGHVARKIAATLASTGTPAYFVHPGEASHGDMGMITANDIVLMLSNSGENAELSDLIHYTRRYDITLIAITSNPQSTLASHSTLNLLLPKVPEACPNGLAPTTSTTMMIALGDALAVALLARMELSAEQYKVFHPGGKLGQRLMSVEEMMIPLADMARAAPDMKMGQAIIELTEKNLGALVITDEKNTLLGIITDGDLKRHMGDDLLQKSTFEVMTQNPKSISSKALAVQALDLMTKHKEQYLTSLIVIDDGQLKGMIRLQDCLQAGLA